jgi:uncharacterized phiE125 gp8 family phage protein
VSVSCYPVSRPVRTTEPTSAQEPITLAEAKKQCEVADGVEYHDEHLRRLITAAREQVEHDTGLVCYTGSFTWEQTQFPCGEVWELPDVRPVTAISSITYVDTAGDSQTLSTSVYELKTKAVTQYIALKYGQSWPSVRGDLGGITTTFVAGYASVLVVPQRVKQACLLALHVSWLLGNEQDAERQQEGYERLVASLRRGTYP